MKNFLISARLLLQRKIRPEAYRKMYRVSTVKIIAIISSSDIYYFIEI